MPEEEEEDEEEAVRENNDLNANSSVCMHGIRAWVKAAGLVVVMRERSDSETPEIHIQTAATLSSLQDCQQVLAPQNLVP